jgi:hypothetical protein
MSSCACMDGSKNGFILPLTFSHRAGCPKLPNCEVLRRRRPQGLNIVQSAPGIARLFLELVIFFLDAPKLTLRSHSVPQSKKPKLSSHPSANVSPTPSKSSRTRSRLQSRAGAARKGSLRPKMLLGRRRLRRVRTELLSKQGTSRG